ncbi:hypothetical protein [Alcanivorax sediminis]|uniref:YD repeat-containing protein n=1 Tax=Alcanivorax sediminis TaxID=2663008 RepID=A0A6N7LU88_9GAMM|nr:hypothetical protein [Alcanivorax sediminis]MQX51981.1 hypothetical protein [Alcanivorax sediminis]
MLKSLFVQSGCLLVTASAFLLSGCGGSSSSPVPSTAAKSADVAPASIEYFNRDTGELTGKVVYDYSTADLLRSRYYAPGEDGLWGTADDTDSLFLECEYVAHEAGDNVLPRQRFLPVHAIARSPTGAAALAASDQPDGEAMYCPPLEGHRVAREEYCTGPHCPDGNGGYRMVLSREREGSVVTDSQTLTAYQDGVEDGLLGQSQQAMITLDEEGRPEAIEIEVLETDFASGVLADACETGSNAALEALQYRSCKLLDETMRYTYSDNAIEREVDYYHGYVFNHTEHGTRTLDRDLNTYTVEIDKNFVSGAPDPLRVTYQLNERDQVTGSTRREAGEDGELDTADDVLTQGPDYHYHSNGNPMSTWQEPGDKGVLYQYDANGRLRSQTVYPDTSGVPSVKNDFDYVDGRLKKEEVFLPLSPEDQTLVLARRITYRAAVDGFPAGFNPDGPQYFSNLTLSGLQRRFDLP